MPIDYTKTLAKTLVLEKLGDVPPLVYDTNPLGSHYLRHKRHIIWLRSSNRTTVPFVSWIDEDTLNMAFLRLYSTIAKDVGNQVDHLTIWNYLTPHNNLVGDNIQIICKPDETERLAEAWEPLHPTIYVSHLKYKKYKDHYILLPAPENLGIATWGGEGGNRLGVLVQESRKVLAVHF